MSCCSRPAVLGGALLLGGLAAPATAQSYDRDQSLAWPATLHPGSTNERVELGDPFGDGREHAFVLRNGRLCVAFEPRHFHWISEPGNGPTGVVDFTLGEVPGASGVPAKDYVYFTTSLGLSSTRLQAASWTYLAPASIVQGAWAGAKRLRSHDLDGAYREDLVALNAAGTQVLTMLSTAGGWTPGPTITPPGTALDVAIGQFDADPEPEIAVLTSTKIAFYNLNLTAMTATSAIEWPNPSGGGLFTPFRDGGDATRDRVAVALEWPNAGEWILQTMDATARDNAISLEATPPGEVVEDWLQPSGLVAVDLDGDSPGLGPDVLVAQNSWPIAYVYVNQATTQGAQQLDADESVAWPFAEDPEADWTTGLTTPPGVADAASLLGEQVGVFSVQSTLPAVDSLYVVPDFANPNGVPGLTAAFMDGVTYTHAAVTDGPCSLHFRVNLPEDAIESGYDHLQVIVWVMDTDAETLPTVVLNEVLPPGAGTLDGNGELLVEQAEFDLELDFAGLDPGVLAWTNGEHFAVNHRWVKVDPTWSGDPGDDIDLDDTSREYFGGFAIRESTNAPNEFEDMDTHLVWLFDNFDESLGEPINQEVPGPEAQGALVGAYLGTPRLPELGPPAPPPAPTLAYYPYEPIPLPR